MTAATRSGARGRRACGSRSATTVALDGIDLARRGRYGLRPARAERRRQDHDRAHPLDADRTPTRGGARRRPRPGDASPTPSALRSASRASSPRSTVSSPARRTCTLMADLCHLGRAEGGRRVAELLDRFDLAEAARKPAATYSGGMRRRLDLAMTLVGDPRIIFLDEPTTGLDPRSRRDVWQHRPRTSSTAASRSSSPRTTWRRPIELADRVAVLDRGRVIAEGHARRAEAHASRAGSIRLGFADARRLLPRARRFPAAVRDDACADPAGSRATAGADSLRDVLDRLHDASVDVERVSVHEPDLDEVFLALTGDRRSGRSAAHEHLRDPGLRHDAAAELPAHAALPVGLAARRRDPGDPPAAVRLRVRRHARRRARRGGWPAAPPTSTT